jgi:hypothetical protein
MFNSSGFRVRWKQLTVASLSMLSVGFSQSVLSAPLGSQTINQTIDRKVDNINLQRVVSSQAVQLKLNTATSKLSSIETVLSKVESSKTISSAEAEQVSKQTFEYAENIKQALDTALQEASTLAETQGAKGNISSLETFEKTEEANLPRLQNIEEKGKALQLKIQRGEIQLNKESLQQFSTNDKQNFFNQLESPARQIYIQQQPGVFKGIIVAPSRNLKSSDKFSIGSKLPSATGVVGNNAPAPRLYAVAAAGCVGLAVRRDWSGLARCVVSAGGQATNIYNQFVSCWNSASGFWGFFKKIGCVAQLIARIA